MKQAEAPVSLTKAALILHIGLEKTGTTSLQDFLHAHRNLLHAGGVLYPEAVGPRHVNIPLAAQAPRGHALQKRSGLTTQEDVERFRRDVTNALSKEVKASNCETADRFERVVLFPAYYGWRLPPFMISSPRFFRQSK
jgi:hypothetical protein